MKHIAVKALSPEFTDKGLNERVFPRTARGDEQGVTFKAAQPVLDSLSDEFRAIITANENRFSTNKK